MPERLKCVVCHEEESIETPIVVDSEGEPFCVPCYTELVVYMQKNPANDQLGVLVTVDESAA